MGDHASALGYASACGSTDRTGGEKNYLEFFYRRPVHLITAAYAVYATLLGWPAGNVRHASCSLGLALTRQSESAGQLFISAAGGTTDRWNSRAIGVGIVTFCLLVNGTAPRAGLWLSNLLGLFKVAVLSFIVITCVAPFR